MAEPPAPDVRALPGPFDIIGDIHGCAGELDALLHKLGYRDAGDGVWRHAGARTAVFLGDLTDRGPASVAVLRRVIPMVQTGAALYTPGNHCNKLWRALRGNRVRVGRGLQMTLDEFAALPPDERETLAAATRQLIEDAPPYLILDGGALVVAHAGIRADMIGRTDEAVRAFCLYGDTTGKKDEQGHPIRRDWAQEYGGPAAIVYGHQVQPAPVWVNNTINIDQGCVFGGALTALRWPEREIVQVPAAREYMGRNEADLT